MINEQCFVLEWGCCTPLGEHQMIHKICTALAGFWISDDFMLSELSTFSNSSVFNSYVHFERGHCNYRLLGSKNQICLIKPLLLDIKITYKFWKIVQRFEIRYTRWTQKYFNFVAFETAGLSRKDFKKCSRQIVWFLTHREFEHLFRTPMWKWHKFGQKQSTPKKSTRQNVRRPKKQFSVNTTSEVSLKSPDIVCRSPYLTLWFLGTVKVPILASYLRKFSLPDGWPMKTIRVKISYFWHQSKYSLKN